MRPDYHSQRPLSRDNLEGQTAIDLAVIQANSSKLVLNLKAVIKGVFRSITIGVFVYPLFLVSPVMLFVAVHTGDKSWAAVSVTATLMLALSVLIMGRSAADVVDKTAEMGAAYADTVNQIVEAILLSKAGEESGIEISITEVGENVSE